MSHTKTVLVFVTIGMIGTASPSHGETPGFSIPEVPPTQLVLGALSSAVAEQLRACQADRNAVISADEALKIANDAYSKKAGKKNKKTKDCYGADDEKINNNKKSREKKTKFSCSMSCEAPDLGASPSCDQYFGNATGKVNKDALEKGLDAILSDRKKYETYLAFQEFKLAECEEGDKKLLDVEKEYLQCQLKVLANASKVAGEELIKAINANQVTAKGYDQAVNGVQQQLGQVVQVLGDDPDDPVTKMGGDSSAQFGGLFGIQKRLQEGLSKWNALEKGTGEGGGYISKVARIGRMPAIIEQKLEARRMQAVGKCMVADAGGPGAAGSYTCRVNEGNRFVNKPCGAMQYIETLLRQAAFQDSKGNIIKASSQRIQAADRFGNVFQQIQGELAGAFSLNSGGGAAEEDNLAPQFTSWDQLPRGVRTRIDQLQSELKKRGIRFDFKTKLTQVAQTCFRLGDNLRAREKSLGSDSAFQRDLEKYSDDRIALAGEIQNSLNEVRDAYSQSMAVLSNDAIAAGLDLSKCTQGDPVALLNCFSRVRQGVQGLKDGTGVAPMSRVIRGLPAPPPFGVPNFTVNCKGIDSCVTVFSKVRRNLKEVVQQTVNARAQYVNNGNQGIRAKIGEFGQFLGSLQAQADAQYKIVAGLLTKVGGKNIPDALNRVKEQEPLSEDCPEGALKPCPVNLPKNANQVLAGVVQPGGLIDFGDTGLNAALADAAEAIQEKKKDSKEGLEPYTERADKLSDLRKDCYDQYAPDNVKNEPGVSCEEFLNACEKTTVVASQGNQTLEQLIISIEDGLVALSGESTTESEASATNQANRKIFADVKEALTKVNAAQKCTNEAIRACQQSVAGKANQFEADRAERNRTVEAK